MFSRSFESQHQKYTELEKKLIEYFKSVGVQNIVIDGEIVFKDVATGKFLPF